MTDIDQIPAEMRWRLATRVLTSLPLAYNWALRDSVGEAYPHLERAIFKEIARDSRDIAFTYQLPKRTAMEIASTFRLISSIIFGPKFLKTSYASTGESAVMGIRECPICDMAEEMGIETERAHSACRAYCSTIVEALNPEYILINSQSRCLGDGICEMIIQKKE